MRRRRLVLRSLSLASTPTAFRGRGCTISSGAAEGEFRECLDAGIKDTLRPYIYPHPLCCVKQWQDRLPGGRSWKGVATFPPILARLRHATRRSTLKTDLSIACCTGQK